MPVLEEGSNGCCWKRQRPCVFAGAIFNQKGLDIRALKRHLKAAPPFGGHLTSFPGGVPLVLLLQHRLASSICAHCRRCQALLGRE